MPTPPALTDEQRRAAYEKALELRQRRAGLKANITRLAGAGGSQLGVIKMFWPEESIQGMKVMDLLTALPNVGPKTARAWLKSAGIPEKNTVRACGPRQAERLFHLLNR